MTQDKVSELKGNILTEQLRVQYGEQISNPSLFKAHPHTCVFMDEGSLLDLNGTLELGVGCMTDYERSTILRLDRLATLFVTNGSFRVSYGADIQVFSNATLQLGNSYINSNCKIRCGKSIQIGDNCVISHDVTIIDSDFHELIIDGEKKPRRGEGLVISDHVWIGTRVTVLKNVTIGEGAVIAAGSVVTSDVPPHTLVAGVPAKVIKENVDWEI